MSLRTLLLAALACVACADESAAPVVTADAGPVLRCDVSKPPTMVFSRFAFARLDTMRAGVADGFDLDDHDSYTGDSVGCRRPDYTAPDGRAGIDNQLAVLIPVVDSMTGGALDGAIQGAINNGQLLVAFTVEDVQSRCDDPDVTLVVRRASGMPFVGADMRLDPGQTFDVVRDAPVTRVHGRIVGGVLTTDPVDLPLPVEVLTARFTLNLYGARIRMRFDDNGGGEGVIGGGISIEEFTEVVSTFKIPTSLRDAVGSTMRLVADLTPDADGRCQRLSAAVAITLRPAFLNP